MLGPGSLLDPSADALFSTRVGQSDVSLSQRKVPPAAPQPGRARDGAVSVTCARAEQFVVNIWWPIIVGRTNEAVCF